MTTLTRTSDDLDATIEGDKQRIHLIHEGDPHTIRRFHERQKEIDHIQERIANFEADLAAPGHGHR